MAKLRFDGFYICLDMVQFVGIVRILYFKPDRKGIRTTIYFNSDIRQDEAYIRKYIYHIFVKIRRKVHRRFYGYLMSRNVSRKVLGQPFVGTPLRLRYVINQSEITLYYIKGKDYPSDGWIKTDSLVFSDEYELYEFVAFRN